MFTTESEAWTAIADTLEMIEDLPESAMPICVNPRHTREYYKLLGLREVVRVLKHDGLISESLAFQMIYRLALARRRRGGRKFFYPLGEWKPRARLARRLAEQTRTVQQEGV